MEIFGDELRIQQGEDFNYDYLLSSSSEEYIPFIVSNERLNPFFVLTIASTKYEKNLRYCASWWQDIKNGDEKLPLFYQTVPYKDTTEYATKEDLPTTPILFENNQRETAETRLLYQYTLTSEEIDEELGHRPYHYYYFEYTEDGVVAGRVDSYECRIRFNIQSTETSKWGSQNYMYQITLVSGELQEDVIESIKLAHDFPADWPDTVEEIYAYIKVRYPSELQPDIDVDSPLWRVDNPESILRPTKLQVDNNLRTII